MTAWLDPATDLDARVAALVADLSQEDLIQVALGDFGCLTSRGLPSPDYVDASSGLRDVAGATAFPAGIALAATFDPLLAEEYGRAVGAETRAAGFSVLLGPTLDLARDPRGGRIPEGLGEDPYLTGLIGAAHVRGVQHNHVICQLKHFLAYNSEARRTGEGLGADRGPAVDVRVSDQVLADGYLRPFEEAIRAGAWSMMGSYNRVNGRYACQSADLLAIPRQRWGWGGFYCPDFLFAVRDDAEALAAGLDLPALGGSAGRTRDMVAARPEAATELTRNLVRALIGSGLVDDPLPDATAPSTVPHRELAERIAVASAALLVNRGQSVPFGSGVRSIALIGPTGTDAIYVVGGSAAVSLEPDRLVTPAAGVKARAGATTVILAQGSLGDAVLPPVPPEALGLPDGSGPGVEVEFTDAAGMSWTETLDRIDHAVDPLNPAARWPRRWRTRLTSQVTGRHRISLALGGRASLRLDRVLILAGSREAQQFISGPHYPLQAVVELVAGVPVTLDIDYEPGPAITIPPMGLGPTLRLGWQPPDELIEQAVSAAASADAAVVVVNAASGEGMDRDSLALPGDQDDLVRRVAAVNRHTVVVLNTPGAVLMPWADEVAAILQVWYPGERFGAALAAILFGDAEPGGRLPLTFPIAAGNLPEGDRDPGIVPTALDYDADGAIGYRSPAVRRHGCAFPFGHGMGYAQTRQRLQRAELDDGTVQLTVRVTNLSDRDTTHVVQGYVGVDGTAPELAAVNHVPVPGGGTATALLELGADAFCRWSPRLQDRAPMDGAHSVWLGTSAPELPDQVMVTIRDGSIVAVS